MSNFVYRADEHTEMTDEEWEEWASDNNIIHNHEYACRNF